MQHPIINTLDITENLITPKAVRFLCHQAYINKVDLDAVDAQVLGICSAVQREVRILAGDEWSNTDVLEEVMACGDFPEYLSEINRVQNMAEESTGLQIDDENRPFFQFLVAFELYAGGEYHRPEVTLQELADVYARFGTSLLDITDADVPVHSEADEIFI